MPWKTKLSGKGHYTGISGRRSVGGQRRWIEDITEWTGLNTKDAVSYWRQATSTQCSAYRQPSWRAAL